MCNLSKLSLKGSVEDSVSMAVDIDPDGRDAVVISISLRIDKISAITTFDDDWRLLFPLLHLGKRMPDERMVVTSKTILPILSC